MLSGYKNRLLRVDLTGRECEVESTRKDWVDTYIGGKGLAARYLYELLPERVDPLSPRNVLIFMTGPLTGTIASTMSRVVLVTKSPLTNTFLDSYAGGYFPAELKFAGFDGIIVSGRSPKDVYLWIKDGQAELRDATHLKGMDTHKTTTQILKETEKAARVGVIGPAGENLVKYAGVAFDLYHFAGRGGAGAVMGSKKLKAVAVRGTESSRALPINFEKNFQSLVREVNSDIRKNPFVQWAITVGTPSTTDYSNRAGIMPTRNFQAGVFERAHEIDSTAFIERILVKHLSTCFSCSIGCRNNTEIRDGKHKGLKSEGPEYETITVAGSNCGIGELGAIAAFNDECAMMGIDTISAGAAVAFAMELFERGVLGKSDVNGLDLRFGNEEAYVQMPHIIAHRKGVGDLLAEGTRTASAKIGKQSERYTVEVKGMDYPGYDPRGSVAMGLAYATSDRGACHKRAWPVGSEAFGQMDPFTTNGKAKLVVDGQVLTTVQYSLVACQFLEAQFPMMSKLLEAVTGIPHSVEELETIGRRTWTLIRLFNIREGLKRSDDSLPYRISEEELRDGRPKGHRLNRADFEYMLDEYYKIWDWDQSGSPTTDTLRNLGLTELN